MIASGVRIPQVRQNGALLNAMPLDLSTLVARHAIERSGLDPEQFNTVHWGMMYQTEGSSVHLPKQTAIAAGLPATVPATLTNRLCGSGLEAVVQGARAICLGEAEVALAGSTDCISRVAALHLKPRQKLHGVPLEEDPVMHSTLDEQSGKRMAELVECFARNCGVDRAAMDDFAFQSRQRAASAQKQGLFKKEIVDVTATTLRNDAPDVKPLNQDHIESRWPTRDSLARLDSRYGPQGRITRGNSSAFADGAAALILASPAVVNRSKQQGLAAIRSWAITAAGPCQMGEALVAALNQALSRAQISASQVECFELEEAFAANCVYATQTLSLPMEKVNLHGGALALGHPPATSGLRQLLHAAHVLRTSGGTFALIGLSAGASQAMALVLENTP
jgi:acetyl-CoA acetyltransferase family protein